MKRRVVEAQAWTAEPSISDVLVYNMREKIRREQLWEPN